MTANVHGEIELPAELGRLASLIDEKPEACATGDRDIQDAALAAAKYIFDMALRLESRSLPHLKDLLESLEPTRAPRTRAQSRTAERLGKKVPRISHDILNTTPLSALFVDGMDDEQIWAQLELKTKNVCETLTTFEAAGDVDQDILASSDDYDDDEDELDSDELDELARMHGQEINPDSDSSEEDEDENDSSGEEPSEEKITDLRDTSSEEEILEDEDTRTDLDASPSGREIIHRRRGKGHAELDEGFFRLDDFNAEIEEAESKNVSRGLLSKGSDDDDSDEDDVDFFRPLDEHDVESGSREEAYYKDFFDPPPKSARPPKRKADTPAAVPEKRSKVRFNEQVKVKTIKSRGKGLSLSSVDLWMKGALNKMGDDDERGLDEHTGPDDDSEAGSREEGSEPLSDSETSELDQGREAIKRLKDDLLADDDDVDAANSGMSTHESRMEELRKQISELEAENIAEKDWVLKGEVTSRARPQNALLEEDLEFERVAKAVPVVTDEVVQDLEARIRARIIEGRFDDVVRKRPVDDKPFLPSQVFELQDTKSKESLAQIYENEYMASQTSGPVNDSDARLKKEHGEIEKEWESICNKLDALCNSHFTPKQPKATIATVSNVPAVTLESALPTSKSAASVLAPEEVFSPGTSDLRSKSELTPAEKQTLRLKERKKRKKQRQLLEKNVDKFGKSKRAKGAKREKEDVLKSLVKSGKGVTVIGKKSQELKKGRHSRYSGA